MATTDVKKDVRARYASLVTQEEGCCGPALTCCGNAETDMSKQVGYTDEDLAALPEGANLGLGCGNPVALAALKEGDVVVDLGSGAGIDCFLAAKQVGATGRVIGIDMTPEMIDRARTNAERGKYENVEFRLGEIEALPIADGTVDVIISNCVINLSPEKERVFAEAFRVLKPGGKCYISDIVLLKPLPDAIRNSAAAYSACVAGAMLKDDYFRMMTAAGFGPLHVLSEAPFPLDVLTADPNVASLIEGLESISAAEIAEAAASIVSVKVEVEKSPWASSQGCGCEGDSCC